MTILTEQASQKPPITSFTGSLSRKLSSILKQHVPRSILTTTSCKQQQNAHIKIFKNNQHLFMSSNANFHRLTYKKTILGECLTSAITDKEFKTAVAAYEEAYSPFLFLAQV
jgi:hypothetical protein